MTLAPFPDPERAVADLLGDLVQASYPGARTLATIQSGKFPAVRVIRQPGGSRDRVTDRSVISVAVFAKDADSAKSIAEQCCQRLARGPFLSDVSFQTQHGRIDGATVDQAPQMVTASDVTAVQCATATYTISMRR